MKQASLPRGIRKALNPNGSGFGSLPSTLINESLDESVKKERVLVDKLVDTLLDKTDAVVHSYELVYDEKKTLRVVNLDGEPFVVGIDASKALGHTGTYQVRNIVSQKNRRTVSKTPGLQWRSFYGKTITVINWSGVEELYNKSTLPLSEAKMFMEWLHKKLQIRDGMASQKQAEGELLSEAVLISQRLLKERDQRIRELEEDNNILKPKAEYFDDLVAHNNLTSIRDTAKLVNKSERVFIKYLLSNNYLYRANTVPRRPLMPYSKHLREGIFVLKEYKMEDEERARVWTVVTPKGRDLFRKIFIRGTEDTACEEVIADDGQTK